MNRKSKELFCLIVLLNLGLVVYFMFFIYMKDNDEVSLVSNAINSVVEVFALDVEGNQLNGTGFVVNTEGYIITNKHVVFNSENQTLYTELKARFFDSDVYINLELISLSETDDLALLKLKVEDTYFDYLSFEDSSNILYGENIFCIGNIQGYGLSVIFGNVAAPKKEVIYNDSKIIAIQLDLDISPGVSGGPIINYNGDIIGIATFRLLNSSNEIIDGMNFALPSDRILKLLIDNEITYSMN
ncbi:MAG: serine protease [Candidatus Izemoplasma sp.]